MPNYRRYYVPGGTYFFTIVTFGRRPLFADKANRGTRLRQAIETIKAHYPFAAVALRPVAGSLAHRLDPAARGLGVLPPLRRRIKEEFTQHFLAVGGMEGPRCESRVRHGERAVWQRRFWEHTIRDGERPRSAWTTSTGTRSNTGT